PLRERRQRRRTLERQRHQATEWKSGGVEPNVRASYFVISKAGMAITLPPHRVDGPSETALSVRLAPLPGIRGQRAVLRYRGRAAPTRPSAASGRPKWKTVAWGIREYRHRDQSPDTRGKSYRTPHTVEPRTSWPQGDSVNVQPLHVVTG